MRGLWLSGWRRFCNGVPERGLEPLRPEARIPKTRVSTYSTTLARGPEFTSKGTGVDQVVRVNLPRDRPAKFAVCR